MTAEPVRCQHRSGCLTWTYCARQGRCIDAPPDHTHDDRCPRCYGPCGGDTTPSDETAPQPAPVIDAAHLARQRGWSARTFGPGRRTNGILAHIRKELDEIAADPDDITEWIDVVILALDGAWRHGAKPQQIIDALITKQTANEARAWPDWRDRGEDEPIEHVRDTTEADQ